jgi:hypothetical protein
MSDGPVDWRRILEEQQPHDPGPRPPPAPRSVRFRHLDFVTRLLVILSLASGLPVFGGGAAAVVLMPKPWDNWILDFRGETARGVVSEIESVSVAVKGNQTNRTREVHVDFTDERGKRRKTVVLYDQRIVEGDELEIEYDPESVSRARVAGESVAPMVNAFFMVFPVLAAGLVGMGIAFARLIRKWGLSRNGTPVLARVVSIKPSAGREGNQRVMIAGYEYDTPRGKQTGSHRMVDPPGPGAAIWVIYDPARPERSLATRAD